MSGLRGFSQLLAGIGIGALIGLTLFIMVDLQSNLETTKELYLADTSSLNMLYHARNVQEYLQVGQDAVIARFVESGGPTECGTVTLGGKEVSVWKEFECEVTYSPSLAHNYSGKLAAEEAEAYSGAWGLDAVSHAGDDFRLSLSADLQFAEYHSRVDFDSPLGEAVDLNLRDMESAYGSQEGDSTCMGDYRFYWTDVNGYNFTYAVMGECD